MFSFHQSEDTGQLNVSRNKIHLSVVYKKQSLALEIDTILK